MELSQFRPLGSAQDRKATDDFLSLYSHSSLPQDPRPCHGDLKTHNFLQPVEGDQKNSAEVEKVVDINVKLPPVAPSTSAVEHVLPGGIGTYSISRLPNMYQKAPKPDQSALPMVSVTSSERNDSNCSSYTGGSFTLWDESTMKKGHSGKENLSNANLVKESTKAGYWHLDGPSHSSSNRRSSVSPLSPPQAVAQKDQSFMEMLKSAKQSHSMEKDDEGDLSIKKESNSFQKGDLQVKVVGKNSDQKASTPRSKHSATEQRRRCKINDRFQSLREIIPRSDQKRDKASFLLEVIEYIQLLQEKVNRYEGLYPGLNSKTAKFNPRSNNNLPNESFVDQPNVINGITNPVLMFGAKLDEKATAVSVNIPRNAQIQAESSMINSINFKATDQQSGSTSNLGPISSPVQPPDVYAPFWSSYPVAQPLARIADPTASLPQLQLWQSITSECQPSATGVILKDQEVAALEGGTINISSLYSQELLNTLTRALESSGVDLSQSTIAVQVDVGKRANNRQYAPDLMPKSGEARCINQSLLRGRVENASNEESDRAIKKLKSGYT